MNGGGGGPAVSDTDPIDPFSGYPAEVRQIQPYGATKRYICPGCNQDIEVGVGHLAIIPREAPDLRRHWHRACWERRTTRRPGRSSGDTGKGRGGGKRGPPATR